MRNRYAIGFLVYKVSPPTDALRQDKHNDTYISNCEKTNLFDAAYDPYAQGSADYSAVDCHSSCTDINYVKKTVVVTPVAKNNIVHPRADDSKRHSNK